MTDRVIRPDRGREEITRLWDDLRGAARPRAGVLPRDAGLERLRQKWLPAGSFVCRNRRADCDPSSCNNRCSSDYWLGHSRVVASLMRRVAQWLGDDPDLYQAAGDVHDLDYVKAPHDLGGRDVSTAHPVPLVRDLIEMNAPPILSLAVLEHSPHLNLEPSSPLGDALIACDDAATLASMGYDATRQAGLPPKIAEIISAAPSGALGGRFRNGMQRRMLRAFDSLGTRDYHFPGAGGGGKAAGELR